MRPFFRVPVLVAALVSSGVGLAQTPDPVATRAEIDGVLGRGGPPPTPTLGRIVEIADLSISYGAPAYNEGNIDGCQAFYRKSMADLLGAWEHETPPDPAAREALDLLRESLDRATRQPTADGSAWALRYGWDRVSLLYTGEAAQVDGLVKIGIQYLKRGDLPEADSAFGAGAALAEQVVSSHTKDTDVGLRMARLLLGSALFAEGKYPDAAAEVALGLALVPEWLDYDVDRATIYGGPPYADALAGLERAAEADGPHAADLRFLLAYEYAMTGNAKKSDLLLRDVLKVAPEHSGARLLAAGLEQRKRR